MKNILLFCLILMLNASASFAQGINCAGMEPICTDVGLSFPAGVNNGVGELGNNYGCLGSTPNPAWYYFEIATNGNIDMELNGNGYDVDFIIWGPFPDLSTAQSNCGGLTAGQIVDCSYSATTVEDPSIPGASVGNVYIMLITNFSNQPTNITLSQTGGSGSTDCTILNPCSVDAGPDQVLCAGGPGVTIGANPITVDEGATYSWSGGAGSGTIDLTAPGVDNGQVVVSPAVTTIYTVTTDFGGCIATDNVTVTIDAPPTASNPANINAQCVAPAPDINVVTDENDDYTIPPTVTFIGEVSDGLSCPETITRTYRVTDGCGSFIDLNQLVIINDTQAPVFAAPPADVTVQCVGDVPAMISLGYTDNCDAPGTVAGTDGVLVGGDCGGTITRTWIFTDACGNPATTSQTITIDDTTPPTASNPASQVGVPPAPDVNVVTDEADNCGIPTVTYINEISDGQTCPETITRTYRVTDACGNFIDVFQTFTVFDAIMPTASNPVSENVECAADVSGPNIAVVTDEADNSGVVPVVTWESDVSNGNSCPETITRTYKVTDDCGNFIFVTQMIVIDDITNPSLTNLPPPDITLQCGESSPAMTDLNWMDNCDGAGSISGMDGAMMNGVVTRTWNFIDACGNNASDNQLITFTFCLPEAPNVITPNEDLTNDFFHVKNLEFYPGSKLVVLNRWGNVVYENPDYDNLWSGGELVEGVYFYEIEININPSSGISELEDGNTLKGFVQIVR